MRYLKLFNDRKLHEFYSLKQINYSLKQINGKFEIYALNKWTTNNFVKKKFKEVQTEHTIRSSKVSQSENKKRKKNNIVTADQAWPGKVFLDTFLASEVRNRVFDVSWGVYWFLDYRPRARKDLRDETHDSLHTHTHTHTYTHTLSLSFSFLIFLLSRSVSPLILSTRLQPRAVINESNERIFLPCD